MNACTPGEWAVSGNMIVTPPPEEVRRRIHENELPATSRRICIAEPSHYVSAEECEANLQMMAAAKKLFAACQAALAFVQRSGCGSGNVESQLMAAIAEASK